MDSLLPALGQHFTPATLSAAELCVRLGLAAFLGGLLGLDREFHRKTLGWRTYMLVSLGAASFSVMMAEMVATFEGEHLQLDPTRIVEGVIGGIGFMGAGAMIQDRGRLRGATTGAGIWMAGAIGMAAGFGFHLHAVVMTAFAFLVISLLGALSRALRGGGQRARPPLGPDRAGDRAA